MRPYKEVEHDKGYRPSRDEIKAMNDALSLVESLCGCEASFAPIADNLYAKALYMGHAMPVLWKENGEEYYTRVWIRVLDNKRDVEVQVGQNSLEIVETKIFKNGHEFCYEACNDTSGDSAEAVEPLRIWHEDDEESEEPEIEVCQPLDDWEDEEEEDDDDFWEGLHEPRYEDDEPEIECCQPLDENDLEDEGEEEDDDFWEGVDEPQEVIEEQHKETFLQFLQKEANRLVRLSKREQYRKDWENQYGSKPENTPYDDFWNIF